VCLSALLYRSHNTPLLPLVSTAPPLERGIENIDILFIVIVRNMNQGHVYAQNVF
jgi:hypothetical protein